MLAPSDDPPGEPPECVAYGSRPSLPGLAEGADEAAAERLAQIVVNS